MFSTYCLLAPHPSHEQFHRGAPQDHTGIALVDKLGNGRFARNVVENAETQRLERFMQVDDLSQLSDSELTTLTGEDVRTAVREVTKSVL